MWEEEEGRMYSLSAALMVREVKLLYQLSNRPGKSDHVTEFSREDSGVFKMYKVINVEPMSRHC
jgi:hypothetical protein